MRRLTLPSTLLVLFTASCGDPSMDDTPTAFEGDAAGECVDAADNDRDGLFDCNDDDCAGSPDCEINAADSCAAYVAAANICFEEAGVTGADVSVSFCEPYADLTGDAATIPAKLLDCYAAAYNNADCSTTEGVTAASSAVADCATAP